MKARTSSPKRRQAASAPERPRMTRALAEQRSVGDDRLPVFDGVKFIQSLKR